MRYDGYHLYYYQYIGQTRRDKTLEYFQTSNLLSFQYNGIRDFNSSEEQLDVTGDSESRILEVIKAAETNVKRTCLKFEEDKWITLLNTSDKDLSLDNFIYYVVCIQAGSNE